MRRILLSLTGLYVSLAVAPALAAQEPPAKERLRFLDGRVELCEVVSRDDAGVVLKLEGVSRPVRFPWWQLDPAEAARLRERTPAPIPVPAAGDDLTVEGLRVRTTDGRVFEGIPVGGAPATELWLRNAEGRFTVPLASVASQEKARFDLARIHGPEEVFQILVGRLRPSTAGQYDRLGAELLRAKLKDRALSAFRTAELLRHPDWPESRIHGDLVRLRDRLEGIAVRRAVFEAEEGCLAGDYDRALAQLDAAERGLAGGAPEGVIDELRRLRAQLESLRGIARDERIVHEGYRTIEAFVKARAMDRAVPWAEARAYVEERMAGEVLEHLRWRFNFSPGDVTVRQVWERRPEELLRKHSWDEASWLVLKPEVRDPQAWWAAAPDLARYRALKGLYAERHLRVLAAESKSCGACGGSGQESGGATCAACLGVKLHRVVIYR